jgi:nucleoside-diphosphate-sugar epimerase
MSELHTVLGATGGAGRAIAEALIAEGHRVRSVNRAGTPLPGAEESMAADIETAEGALTAVAGSDVVYDQKTSDTRIKVDLRQSSLTVNVTAVF